MTIEEHLQEQLSWLEHRFEELARRIGNLEDDVRRLESQR